MSTIDLSPTRTARRVVLGRRICLIVAATIVYDACCAPGRATSAPCQDGCCRD